MKKLYFLLFLFIAAGNAFTQTVADTLVRDSVPILLTDTNSYNTHARMIIYSGNSSQYEDSTTAYLLFYDKQPDTVSYSSIWYRNLRTMVPETVFLPSNDSVQVCNPQATSNGAIFYEEQHDTLVTVKGLLIDPLTMDKLDTVTVFTLPAPVKMVANAYFVLWLKDSVLYRQSFSLSSNTISLGTIDTLTTHATDVCVADYISNPNAYFYGDYAFTSYNNNTFYLQKEDNFSGEIIDSGIISDIHFNFTQFLFYKKDNAVCLEIFYNNIITVLYGNDTLIPEYAVVDQGTMGVKTYGTLRRTAFVPDTFPNVFNYYATDNNVVYASDTFVYPDNSWEDMYAYPFPAGDTVKNIIMHRGFIFFHDYSEETWDLKIIFEVKHNNSNALYLVCSTVSDIGGYVPLQKDNSFGLTVSPNPVENGINITFQTGATAPVSLTMNDITGRQIDAVTLNPVTGKNHYRWQTADLPHGIYLLTLMQDGKTQTVKFVK